MYLKKYSTVLGAAMLCAALQTSCSDDDPVSDGEVTPQPSKQGFFILNRGNEGANNASLAYYDTLTGELDDKYYENANGGSGLGDSAEDMLVYGSKMYVSVTNSNRLAVLDGTGKLIKEIKPVNASDGSDARPRCLTADGGKVYMTCFYSHSVAVLDTASLEVERMIPVGRYPEELVVSGGKLYVANSGGPDYPEYGHTVSVIDLASLEVEKNIEVTINPCALEANAHGDIYVISMGDYGDVPNTLQCIDGKTGEVRTIGTGSEMDLAGNSLYVLYAQYGQEEKVCVSKYNALTGALENDNLIPSVNKVTTLNCIKADAKGNIYITDAPYTETGTVYVFDKDGKEVSFSPIDSKGYDPNAIWVVE